VLGGIILGPSVLGRIPGFTDAIFPAASMATLDAVANLGLVLFLFLVGLETDFRFLISNWRIALSVGALGMIIPFGLGAAIAYGLYNQFSSDPGTVPISFGVFILFIGVAMAITAFPVLCRILTELKLLNTSVGIIVLSAGVGNDVVGWVLLALCVALVNAATGLAALWVVLTAIGYTLFLFFAVRPAFMWVLRRSGSLQNGPTQGVVALTLLMILASSYFTGIIGIHVMFGGFLIGLICPHEGGFAVKLTEKLEDLVSTFLIPLYFALSGLSTNLGLLNNGITWAYVVGVIAVAFLGKIAGGTLAARFNGMVWREAFTIGSLMSCKGLVELIVLNIGLSAKILSTRTFTIFVVMALVTTCATTPIVRALYPHWYQIKLEAWKRGEIEWESGKAADRSDGSAGADSITEVSVSEKGAKVPVNRVLAYLRLDNLPAVLTLVSLLALPATEGPERKHPSKRTSADLDTPPPQSKRPLHVHALRLHELTQRNSSVMQVSSLATDDDFSAGSRDPLLNTIASYGQIRNVAVSGSVFVSPDASFATTLTDRAADLASDLLLIPWSESGHMGEVQVQPRAVSDRDRFLDSPYAAFVEAATTHAPCNTAVLIGRGFGTRQPSKRPALSHRASSSAMSVHAAAAALTSFPAVKTGHHIFLPFFAASDDDPLALRIVMQMARDPHVTATIVSFEREGGGSSTRAESARPSIASASARAPATKPAVGVPQSEVEFDPSTSTSTNVGNERANAAYFAAVRDSLPAELAARVLFETRAVARTASATDLVQEACRAAKGEAALRSAGHGAGNLVVLGADAGAGSSAAPLSLARVGSAGERAPEDAFVRAVGRKAEAMLGAVETSLLVVRVRDRDGL